MSKGWKEILAIGAIIAILAVLAPEEMAAALAGLVAL
jgi:hypothetical protein